MRRALLVLALVSAGCAPSAYTSIRKIDDNTYMMTRTVGRGAGTRGSLFLCKPIARSADLQCSELGEP